MDVVRQRENPSMLQRAQGGFSEALCGKLFVGWGGSLLFGVDRLLG